MVLMVMALTSCGKINNSIIDKPTTGALTMPDYENEVKGRIARFEDGTVMLLPDDGGAIKLTGEMNLSGLNNGDYVRVCCDAIETTYPSSTVVKEMFFQSAGTVDDIPAEELRKLEEMGWILQTE